MAVSSWFAMVIAIYFQISSGASGTFSIYSSTIKSKLGCNDIELYILSCVKSFGTNLGHFTDFLYSRLTKVEETGNTNKKRLSDFRVFLVDLIGAAFLGVGYGFTFLSISKKGISYHVILYFAMFFAGQGQNILNTANVMVFVTSFPDSMGMAVGLMQAYSGLGTSVMLEINNISFNGNPKEFVLCMAILPAIISGFFAIGLSVSYWRKLEQSTMDGYFLRSFACCGIVAAVWLMTMKIIDNSLSLHLWARILTFAVFIVLIGLPILIGLFFQGASFPSQAASTVGSSENVDKETKSNIPAASTQGSRETPAAAVGNGNGNGNAMLKGTILYLVPTIKNINFWIMFISIGTSMGSSTTVMNHMNIFGDPYNYSETEMKNMVSLWSVFTFIGSISGGFLTDWFLHSFGWSRLWVQTAVQLLMIVGNLLCRYVSLIYGASLLAVCYGVVTGLIPTITYELFGVENLRTNYNNVNLSTTLASGFFVFIAKLERGAHKTQHCHGNNCFQYSFITFACCCGISFILSLVLGLRTSEKYKKLRKG